VLHIILSLEKPMRVTRSLLAFALVVLAAVPSIQAQALPAADQAALNKLRADYAAAWAKGDAKAVAALFTADALDINAAAEVYSGRAAIEKDLVESLAGPVKGTTLKITSAPERALKPDVAIGHGTFELHKGTEVVQAGHYAIVYVKTATGWQITSLTGFVPQPPPAPAAPTKKP
jgi:uncharacterized protein (TIGR02246 family)